MDIKYSKKKASISLEATIIMPLFLMAFLLLFSVFNIVRVQVKLQSVCNQMAREISEYAYVFKKVDLDKLSESEILNGFEIDKLGGDGLKLAINTVVNDIILREKAKKYLYNENTDKYLKQMGVVNGLSGLHFVSTDKFNEDGQITILLKYSVKKFNIFSISGDFNFLLAASTISLGSDLKAYNFLSELEVEDQNSSESDKEEECTINIWDLQPHKRTEDFKKLLKDTRFYKKTDNRNGVDFFDKSKNELIYVHSLNTECKTYCKEGKVDRKQVYKKVEDYLNNMINDSLKKKNIIIDGQEIPVNNPSCKMIIIFNESNENMRDEYTSIVEEVLSKADKNLDVGIEMLFSDGRKIEGE